MPQTLLQWSDPINRSAATRLLGIVAIALSLSLIGCGEDTSIRIYKVAKKDQPAQTRPQARAASTMSDQQIVGAIMAHENNAWFFKLTGEPQRVAEQQQQFREIVESIRFEESGKPSWKLSDGWSEQLERGITYARLTQAESGLEATVTSLPFAGGGSQEWSDYVVSNVNRWRDQLQLPRLSDWDEVAEDLEEVPQLSDGGTKAYFVSLVGKGSGSMSGGPFMNQMQSRATEARNSTEAAPPLDREPASADRGSAAPGMVASGAAAERAGSGSSAGDRGLSYDVPDGWVEIPASGMRRAAFSIGGQANPDGTAASEVESQGEQTAELTVIAAGGEIDANIGIWIGQVGEEATEERKQATLEAAETLSVNDVDAKVYSMQGSNDEPLAILVADIPWRDGLSLFVKLKGPAELVQTQREKFVQFVESLAW